MTSEEYVELESTKASRIGEFMSEGTWRIIGSFVIVPAHTEVIDFKPHYIQEQVIGIKQGENIYSCYFCGTPILEHITFKDLKTGRMVNIGNVCVEKLGDQLGQRNIAIAKGLKSLKEKVSREFKKKIHRKDLLAFLDAGMDEWQKKANENVDAKIKEDPNAYWNPPTRTVVKGEKTFELKCTLWEQKDGADKREYIDRNPIKVLRDDFELKGWNVKPMIPEFERLIKEQGFDVTIPHSRTLTKEEMVELARHVQVNVDEYLKKSQEAKTNA